RVSWVMASPSGGGRLVSPQHGPACRERRPCYPPFSPLVSVSDMMRANAAIRVLLFHRQGRLSSEPRPPRLTARTSPRRSWLHQLAETAGELLNFGRGRVTPTR